MRKFLLVLVAGAAVVGAKAQRVNIQSASNSLRNKEYKDAVTYIERAVTDPSTISDPKAWFIRGQVYLSMDQDPGYADKGYYKEAIKSFQKVIELKPNYEQEQVMQGVLYGTFKSYNNSVIAYNAKKWDEAYENAEAVVNLYEAGRKMFAAHKNVDTIAAGALVIQAYSAFYGSQIDKAIPVLEKLKTNPIEGNADVYMIIADAYGKKGDQQKQLATIEEARAKYPTNTNIRNEELNFYIRTGQQDKLIQKLEAAVAAEPQNAAYQHNLANAYTNMAFPKTSEGKPAPQPANFSELVGKAEAGFSKAISLAPDNIGYHYDMGVLVFNQATKIVEQMNDADDKKYAELEKVRDEYFAKAMPHFEAVEKGLEPMAKSLDNDNKFMYKSSLTAMREIFARQNKLDKSAELKKKIESIN